MWTKAMEFSLVLVKDWFQSYTTFYIGVGSLETGNSSKEMA
jgi:hypothetical protein